MKNSFISWLDDHITSTKTDRHFGFEHPVTAKKNWLYQVVNNVNGFQGNFPSKIGDSNVLDEVLDVPFVSKDIFQV